MDAIGPAPTKRATMNGHTLRRAERWFNGVRQALDLIFVWGVDLCLQVPAAAFCLAERNVWPLSRYMVRDR